MKTQPIIRYAAIAALAGGMAFAAAPAVTTPNVTTPPANTSASQWRAHRQAMRQKFDKELNLTEAQKTQAKAIFQEARASSKPIFTQFRENRKELNAAIKANDAAKIAQLSATQGKLSGELLNVHADARAKFYNLLTPAQRTQLSQIRQARREAMMKRAGHHAG